MGGCAGTAITKESYTKAQEVQQATPQQFERPTTQRKRSIKRDSIMRRSSSDINNILKSQEVPYQASQSNSVSHNELKMGSSYLNNLVKRNQTPNLIEPDDNRSSPVLSLYFTQTVVVYGKEKAELQLPMSFTSIDAQKKPGFENADTASREIGITHRSRPMDSPMSKFKQRKRYGMTLIGNMQNISASSQANGPESSDFNTPVIKAHQVPRASTIASNKSAANLDGYMSRVNSLKRKMTERPRQVSADIFKRLSSQQESQPESQPRISKRACSIIRKTSIEQSLRNVQ